MGSKKCYYKDCKKLHKDHGVKNNIIEICNSFYLDHPRSPYAFSVIYILIFAELGIQGN